MLAHPEEDNYHAGAFLPLGHRLSSIDQIASQHAWLVSEAEMIAGCGGDDLYAHAVRWVPFALPNDGGLAFVDHCPGPTYGHVYEMGIGSGCGAVAWASSLAELFEELSTSLETGAPFRQFLPTPSELPSGHFCLFWDSAPRQEPGGVPGGARGDVRRGGQGWPPARRPAVLRPAVPRPRPLTALGRLVVGEVPAPVAPERPCVEVVHDVPGIGPSHASEVSGTEGQDPD
ncbi:hypothetical protein [Streptomyces sp. Ac-502]|uniref:hypothetical protein n=1 Tax=Streptomyces sp. Ac-502 TaxID=3342801 RepID=UPI0038629402